MLKVFFAENVKFFRTYRLAVFAVLLVLALIISVSYACLTGVDNSLHLKSTSAHTRSASTGTGFDVNSLRNDYLSGSVTVSDEMLQYYAAVAYDCKLSYILKSGGEVTFENENFTFSLSAESAEQCYADWHFYNYLATNKLAENSVVRISGIGAGGATSHNLHAVWELRFAKMGGVMLWLIFLMLSYITFFGETETRCFKNELAAASRDELVRGKWLFLVEMLVILLFVFVLCAFILGRFNSITAIGVFATAGGFVLPANAAASLQLLSAALCAFSSAGFLVVAGQYAIKAKNAVLFFAVLAVFVVTVMVRAVLLMGNDVVPYLALFPLVGGVAGWINDGLIFIVSASLRCVIIAGCLIAAKRKYKIKEV